ncbi:uncharacterized protein LOC143422668 [Xylocopa sonorina]|uniref:uncharacterized protein LOC143422668 n=1 Tax=Xylocopa sonorina TaxID=1818115 RepID=UPI00403B259C
MVQLKFNRHAFPVVLGRQIGIIKSATLQCLVRHGPRRPRYRIQIAGFATDHHRAYSFHWLPVTSRMHDATIRCTASRRSLRHSLAGTPTHSRFSVYRDFQKRSLVQFPFHFQSGATTLVYHRRSLDSSDGLQ